MKIYHKFLLYQNKWIHPYTRIILGGVTYIAYLASILLIMGVVYEHGFTISEHEASQLQTLYRFVLGVFLSEVTLRLLLEYRDTKRTFKKLTWILIALLYLTLIPVIFHRPEEEGAILHFWEILNGKPYHQCFSSSAYYLLAIKIIQKGEDISAGESDFFERFLSLS